MDSNSVANCTVWLSQKGHEVWHFISTVMNSNFSIALLGSLAGAFAGAVAAQGVIEKNKRRELFLSELRNTNAAIMVSFSICNTVLALKKQHSLPLYTKFKEKQAAVEEFNKKKASDELPSTAQFKYVQDFKLFMAPPQPIDTLKDLVFNKISAHGRALSAVSVLEGSLMGLSEVLSRREKVAERFKATISEADAPYYYFGLPLPSGHTNQEYPDLIEAIHSYVNDVIFFSSIICRDLMEHGKRLRNKEKKYAKDSPGVSTADFNNPQAAKLMPPDSDYSDWINGYVEHEKTNQTL